MKIKAIIKSNTIKGILRLIPELKSTIRKKIYFKYLTEKLKFIELSEGKVKLTIICDEGEILSKLEDVKDLLLNGQREGKGWKIK